MNGVKNSRNTTNRLRSELIYAFLVFSFILIKPALGIEPLKTRTINVPRGFSIKVAAAPPLVTYPMMACLDDKGRLYVAESDGRNLTTKKEIEKELPRFIRRLVDTNGDGIYDESTIFADKMTMPEGGLWLNGSLYIISAPYLWRLEDTNDDGVADVREKLLGYMEFDGRANQHGPYLGPNGRLYFSGGHFGYEFTGTDGSKTGKSRAAGIFSCEPDGSDIKIEGQGGINPVDIEFTDTGEMFSTCAIYDSHQGRHDALIHWIPGGLTQRVYGKPLIPDTGYRLPATSRWGQVAPAGLLRYKGSHLGDKYVNSMFACHFNTHKVVKVDLIRQGSSYITKEEDFLSSSSIDFHPTDILEDADGSLILLDTGGWLSWGCPFSKIAKPEIKGAIYRITKDDGEKIKDPYGRTIKWSKLSLRQALEKLKDERPFVRSNAANRIIQFENLSIEILRIFYNENKSFKIRANLIWALSRNDSEPSREIIRLALSSINPQLQIVSAKSLGILEDKKSVNELINLLNHKDLSVIRTAATSLGQIKDSSATDSLFQVIHKNSNDLFVKHAITRSLIEIGDSKSVLKYLHDRSNYLNQLTALRVLENIENNALTPQMVIPFLKSGNTILESEARRIISRNIEWQNEVLNIFDELIKKSQLSDDENQLTESIILEYSDDSNFEIQLINLINGPQSTNTTTLNSLKAMEIMEKFSPPIKSAIESKLFSDSPKVQHQTISLLVKFPPGDKARERLSEIANNKENAAATRVMALEAITKKTKSLSHKDLEFLIEISKSKSNPYLGIQAARVIGSISLKVNETDQVSNIYKTLETASPIQIAHLLKPFRSLNSEEINQIEESHKNIKTLLNPSSDNDTDRKKTLESIESTMGTGNVSRGRAVFFSNKSTCALCHSINDKGGNLGPDLSKLGAIRNKKDFLEAILFPNSTIVNGSENYIITTLSGQTYTGIIQRENSEFIYLANLNNTRQAIQREKIKEMKRSPISLMPTGLNKALTSQELSDLIAFLQSCK